MTNKAIDHLRALNERLDNDPAFLAQFMADFEQTLVETDNRLICSVVDQNYRQATAGDMVAYAMDPNYFDELQKSAMDLFYQYHGQGD